MVFLSRRYNLPSRIVDGLIRYRDERIATGGFLRRVLENDFAGAIAAADETWTGERYKALLEFLYAELPAVAFGSPAAVAAWLGEEVPR